MKRIRVADLDRVRSRAWFLKNEMVRYGQVPPKLSTCHAAVAAAYGYDGFPEMLADYRRLAASGEVLPRAPVDDPDDRRLRAVRMADLLLCSENLAMVLLEGVVPYGPDPAASPEPAGPGPGTRFDEELSARFRAAGIDVGRLQEFPGDPALAAAYDRYAAEALRDLEEAEAFVGPPTWREHERRMDAVARLDPAMPPWVFRVWQVPTEAMLRIEAILSERLGRGFSVTMATCRHPAGSERTPLRLTIRPVVPIGSPSEREAFAAEIVDAVRAETGVHLHLTFMAASPPENALSGFLAGRVVRDGCIETGVRRVVNWDLVDDL